MTKGVHRVSFALGLVVMCFLPACAARATALTCPEVVAMRTEPGSSRGHEDPEKAAAEAVVAADYMADTTADGSRRDVYAYDEDDDLVAIVKVEDVPTNGGWVALGVVRCAA